MPIVQFPSAQIFPTKPRTANLYQASSVQNTWYTVLTTTAGQGLLTRIVFAYEATGSSFGLNNQNMEIRITIDGIQTTITSSGLTLLARGQNLMRVYNFNAGLTPDTFMYNANTYFTSSLQVEVRQISAFGAIHLGCVVDYSIV